MPGPYKRPYKRRATALNPDGTVGPVPPNTFKPGPKIFFDTLEDLLVNPDGFGLESASVLQRAICRIIEGRPLEVWAAHKDVIEALGGVVGHKIEGAPKEVLIIAAIRSAKSLIAAATAIWASQTCDVSGLLKGEIPRYSVLSLSKDNANVVLQHLRGALQKGRLAKLRVDPDDTIKWKELINDSDYNVVGSEFLWHPSGRPVEIRVVAGKRAGGSLVSRWSAGCTLDEAPRMVGSNEGVVNYEDARNAVIGRLLPGATLLSIGSPWQPQGPVYDAVQSEWGAPTKERVIVKARGPMMNPVWWTEERCEELRKTNKAAYQTDVLAEFMDAEESMFPQEIIARCIRTKPLAIPYEPRHEYICAMDPATRNNAWTMVIVDRYRNIKRCVFHKQWVGKPQEPLSPQRVLEEAAEALAEYRLDWFYTDQWAADAIKDLARQLGLIAVVEDWTEKGKADSFQSLATAMADAKIEIPADAMMTKDLRLVKKVPTTKGVSIRLTHTSDGRHCDYAPALARAFFRWLEDEKIPVPKKGDPKFAEFMERQLEEQEERRYSKAQTAEWWEHDPFNPTSKTGDWS